MNEYITIFLAGIFVLCVLIVIKVTETPHNCNAPCTIHFKEPVAEDDVKWNWTVNNNVVMYKDGNH